MYFTLEVKRGCSMGMKPVSDEILKQTLHVYYRSGKSRMAAAASLSIPKPTFQTRLEKAVFRFPELVEQYEKEIIGVLAEQWLYPQILSGEVKSGSVLIGGDAHIWPGVNTITMQAFAKVAKILKPDTIILNGDIIDGARVSRHGATLKSAAPKVSAEIDAANEWMSTFPSAKRRIFTIGNHDMRVDNYLANQASELEDYVGRLSDRFPMWEFCYSYIINDSVEIRHRFRGGIHAAYNNALNTSLTTVTNHTHAQQVTAIRNRRGSHWGVETGMLGDPNHKAFQYAEGTQSRAHLGFAVLTFDEDGILLPPELCQSVNGRPVFRGSYVL